MAAIIALVLADASGAAAADINPQSPLAPLLKNYKEHLASQRSVLPNLTFTMPRQEREGNAWDAYQKAAALYAEAIAGNRALTTQPPAAQLRDPGVRRAAVEFYNATRTKKFDASSLAAAAASYLDNEDKLNTALDSLDALATLTRQIGREQVAAGQHDNASDNAQTLLALGWHLLTMPLNARMIDAGFSWLDEGLQAQEAAHKAAARPDLEKKIAAARVQLAAQREVWEWKGQLLRQFTPVEQPELLLIIRDDMLADADPAFHLVALEYLNEMMSQTLNRPADPVFKTTLDFNQRKSARLLFTAERAMIRQLAEKYESSAIPGIAFQARQMRELVAKMTV